MANHTGSSGKVHRESLKGRLLAHVPAGVWDMLNVVVGIPVAIVSVFVSIISILVCIVSCTVEFLSSIVTAVSVIVAIASLVINLVGYPYMTALPRTGTTTPPAISAKATATFWNG